MIDAKRVKDHPSLMKDTETNAVISTDEAQLRAFKRKKNQIREIEQMKSRQESIETEVSEIKGMLKTILGKLDNDE